MAKPVSPEERERIIAEFATGKSCREIADEFGRSADTISRIARSVGHEFGRTNLANARLANLAYGAERRANIRATTVESVERLLREMFAPTTIHNFGGKDNTYNSRDIDQPTFRDKQSIGQTIATLWRVVESIDKAEQGESDTSALDRIFNELDRVADEHDSPRPVQPETGGGDQP